jgi:L-alanine-DL-glutamate epimerase-like enolase superfamily enzyme
VTEDSARLGPVLVRLQTRLLTAPMPRPWVPEAPHLHLIVVDVEDSDGATGTGFSWTPTIGAGAVRALLDDDIRSFALGRTTDARTLWPLLWTHLHEGGGAGITTIALAGLDTALWDLAGKRAGQPLSRLIGRRRDTVTAYGSGVNLHYPIEELVAQAERWVETGYTAVKIKVGKPDAAEDADRVAAVREVIGGDRLLMLDANQRWDLPTARTRIQALARFDPHWIEEPLRSDDTGGYRGLRGTVDVPIAMGENVHTLHRFRDLIDAGAADILQPNVVRVGGITPFLGIADLIEASAARLAPHLLMELSGPLALTLGTETAVEDVEDADFTTLGLLASPGPLEQTGNVLSVRDTPGLGLDFVRTLPAPAASASAVSASARRSPELENA